jgi:propionyl-CoA carboxylase alpha chain
MVEIPRFAVPDVAAVAGSLQAPLPGTIVSVRVEPGEHVAAGQVLVALEAMKMEHLIRAPHAGTVAEVRVSVGDQVETASVLLVVDADAVSVEAGESTQEVAQRER